MEKGRTMVKVPNRKNVITTSDGRFVTLRHDLTSLPGILRGTVNLPQLILMGAGLLFCLVTMFYADMTVTGPFSVLLWDALLDGKPFSFYGMCLSSGIAPEGAVYDIGLYVVFAVWNLPVWILYRFAGISLTAPGALLWYKLLPTIAVLVSVNVVREIAEVLGMERKVAMEAGVFFLMSSMVILPVFVTAQYDSMPLYCILKGVLWYLKDIKGDKSAAEDGVYRNSERTIGGKKAHFYYLLWFAFSLVLKPLGILILFLFIILREKRMIGIILELVQGCSLLILCKVLCSVSEDYRNSTGGFLQQHLPDLLQAQVDGGYGAISVFALGLVLLYIAAYLYDGTEKSALENGRMAVVLSYGIWAVFCAFGNMTPYWTIYLAPFLVLTMWLSGVKREQMLLVDLIGELCLVIVMIMKFSWVYGGEKTFAYLLLKPLCGKILSGERAVTVAGAFRSIGIETYLPVLEAILVAWLAMTGVAAYRNVVQSKNGQITCTGQNVKMRLHLDARILLLFAWMGELLMALKYMI